MTPDQYVKKLAAFNSTEKYQKELEFLGKLVPHGYLLDYGAGIGTAAKYLRSRMSGKVRRTDKVKVIEPGGYYHGSDMDFNLNNMQFDGVYFMHSIAHIPDIENVLLNVRDNLLVDGGEVVVITPNKAWLENPYNHDQHVYEPDPTVVNHFDELDLMNLFMSIGMDCVVSGQMGKVDDLDRQERLFFVARKP
jgi:SAM-dependent methyltransferase